MQPRSTDNSSRALNFSAVCLPCFSEGSRDADNLMEYYLVDVGVFHRENKNSRRCFWGGFTTALEFTAVVDVR